jgi:chaperone required for assembly of F1-ATPase
MLAAGRNGAFGGDGITGRMAADEGLGAHRSAGRHLVRWQTEHWDPILDWARTALGARFVLSEGIVFVTQPDNAIAAARAAIPSDPWRLGAAHVVTTLTGSALIALALVAGRIDVDAAWAASNVDEDWNMHLWGRDEMALAARAVRFADLQAAGTVLALTA